MSIALPTLLLVAALIPSIAFVSSFYAGKFPRQLTGLSPLAELALYFFWAVPIDGVALRAAGVEISRPVFNIAAHFFGLSAKAVPLHTLFRFFQFGHAWPWIGRYMLLVLLAAVAGFVSRRLVWALRLDVVLPVLRLKAEWFYVLVGRTSFRPRQILPLADVLVSVPPGS